MLPLHVWGLWSQPPPVPPDTPNQLLSQGCSHTLLPEGIAEARGVCRRSPALYPPGCDLAPWSSLSPHPCVGSGCFQASSGGAEARGLCEQSPWCAQDHHIHVTLRCFQGPVSGQDEGKRCPSSKPRACVQVARRSSVPRSGSAGRRVRQERGGEAPRRPGCVGAQRATQQGTARDALLHPPLWPTGQRAPEASPDPGPAGTHARPVGSKPQGRQCEKEPSDGHSGQNSLLGVGGGLVQDRSEEQEGAHERERGWGRDSRPEGGLRCPRDAPRPSPPQCTSWFWTGTECTVPQNLGDTCGSDAAFMRPPCEMQTRSPLFRNY